jgi:hypothetical protein
MKNSNIFWGTILLLTIYKIFTWRIKLDVGFMDGEILLFWFDIISAIVIGVTLVAYIGFSFEEKDDPESFIYWINKFNSLMDGQEECKGNCGMNYCDDNGCNERKRNLVDVEDILPKYKNPPPPPPGDKNKVYKGDILICKKSGIIGFYLGGGYEAIKDGVLKNQYGEKVKLYEFFGDWRDHFTKQ